MPSRIDLFVKSNRMLALGAAMAAAVAVGGCGAGKSPGAESGKTGAAQVSAALDLATGVDHVTLTISGPSSRTQGLEKVNDTHYQATVTTLAAGSGYAFLVQGFDASGLVVLGGQATDVTIEAGRTAQVNIILHEPTAPTGERRRLPVLDGLSASTALVPQNSPVAVSVTAHSPEGHALAHEWSDGCGGHFASATEISTTWTSPGVSGTCQLAVRIVDAANATSVTGYLVVVVQSPAQTGDADVQATVDAYPVLSIGVVDEFVIFQEPAPAGRSLGITAVIHATASDPEGGGVTHLWTATCDEGTSSFSPSAGDLDVTFRNDSPNATCTLTLTATDVSGQSVAGTIELSGFRCANVTCGEGEVCDPADGQCKATTGTYAISGTVSGAVADGALITLGGDASRTATTAGGGLFSFTGLADGSYTLTPSMAGYTFSPAIRSVTVNGAGVTGQDFVSTASSGSIFFDDFEGGLGDWSPSNGVWEVGAPTSGPNACFSGTSCAATVLAGNYPNTNSNLVSPPFTLPALGANEELHLRFWHWFSFASSDQGVVYIQEQTSPGVWSAAEKLWTYTATSGVWTRPMVDLSGYEGKTVRILFELYNYEPYYVSAGWYIDDVSVSVVQVGDSLPYDGFEGGLGNWWASNGTWQVGSPTSGPGGCHEGTQCAATALAGNYPNTNTDLVSPSLTLPAIGVGQTIQLRFWHWFSFASSDRGIVYIQEQTSPGVWGEAVSLDTYGATSGAWTRPMVPLSAYAEKRVRILFQLNNYEPYYESTGWYIDEISIAVVVP
jgi:hypothetical protein